MGVVASLFDGETPFQRRLTIADRTRTSLSVRLEQRACVLNGIDLYLSFIIHKGFY